MRSTPHIRPIVAFLAIATLVAACAGRPGSSPGGSPASSPPSDLIVHPAGDHLVLRVDASGGLVPAEFVFTHLPAFTLTGDGRVIVEGPQTLIYPGRALPPLVVRALTASGIQDVLRLVTRTGLFDHDRTFHGAANFIMDAPTTVFTLNADGRSVRVSVYALGDAGTGPWLGLSTEEADARRILAALAGELQDLQSHLGVSAWRDADWHAYRPETLRLLVRNVDGDEPEPGGLATTEQRWPIKTDPATYGDPATGHPMTQPGQRCAVASGAEADAWMRALDRATTLTRFVAGGHRYQVLPRPLLPDEPATCPTVPAI